MNMVGTAGCYYTWDNEKSSDGLYHVGEGGHWGGTSARALRPLREPAGGRSGWPEPTPTPNRGRKPLFNPLLIEVYVPFN